MFVAYRCQSKYCGLREISRLSRSCAAVNSSPVFTSVFSPATGKFVWKMKPSDYDYVQELARSAYADMLHDCDRNEKYEAGVRSAITEMKRRGIEPRVLDIGTGTGLLSMMACRHGANDVIACEAFLPMASLAEQIIKDNGFQDKIRIVRKRSTEMTSEEDLGGQRANILVTEVFDTELIGEGAIATFRHALDHLLTKDCIVVPSQGRMYVQVVSSDLVRRWHRLCPFQLGDARIDIPATATYPAGNVFYDLQLSSIPREAFTSLSPPLRVFEFDFSGNTRLLDRRNSVVPFEASADGVAHGLFMWWDLKMDVEGRVWIDMAPNNVLSPTAREQLRNGGDDDDGGNDGKRPRRHRREEEARPWRDHWMQALYFLSCETNVTRGQNSAVLASHDEYSLAFDLTRPDEPVDDAFRSTAASLSPLILSRTKLGFLNCVETRQKLVKCLEKVVGANSVVCCVGEGSLLPIICACLGADRVFVLDSNRWTADLISSIARHNGVESRIKIVDKAPEDLVDADFESRLIDAVVSDMWFHTLSVPWDGLYYLYALKSLKRFMNSNCTCLPRKGELKGMCLSMQDLWKIRAAVGNTAQGFDLSKFDAAILSACDNADPLVEPQPLWEYPSRAVSKVGTLMTFETDMFLGGGEEEEDEEDEDEDEEEEHHSATDFQLWTAEEENKLCFNGIAFWMDWIYDDDTAVSTGLARDPEVGGVVAWNRNFKQGVYIYDGKSRPDAVKTEVVFRPHTGDVSFHVRT